MTKKLKKNWLLLLFLFVWTLVCIYAAIDFGYHDPMHRELPDVMTSFIYLYSYDYLGLLQLFGAPLVCLFGLYSFYQEIESEYVKLKLTRESYTKYLWNHIKNSLKHIFLIPSMILILWIVCLFMFQFQFDIEKTAQIHLELASVVLPYKNILVPYFIFIFLKPIFLSIVWLEIGFCFMKRERNFAIPIFLVFIGDYMIVRMIDYVSSFLQLENSMLSWNFMIFLSTDLLKETIMSFILIVIIGVIFLIPCYFHYRSKEKFVMMCEEGD